MNEDVVYSYVVVKEYPRNGIDYFDIEDFSTIGIYKKNSKAFEKDFFNIGVIILM